MANLFVTRRRGIEQTITPEAADSALAYPQPPVINGTPGGVSWDANTPAYLPIVPGGAGWAMSTTAGSGRHNVVGGVADTVTVYFITNTNLTGPGSLKAAFEAGGTRIVIPAVSGVIDYSTQNDDNRQIDINDGRMIYAGQCAPSPGLHLHGVTLVPRVHTAKDVLLWHYSSYHAPYADNTLESSRGDVVQVFTPSASAGQTNCNLVVANSWFSWGNDEIIDANQGVHNVSFYECVFAEALANTDTVDGLAHPFGPLISRLRNESRGDFTRCIFTRNQARNPLTRAPLLSIHNCLLFDCYQRGISLESLDLVTTQTNIEGNVFVMGPNGSPSTPIFKQTGGQGQLASTSTYYLSGNRAIGWSDATQAGLVSSGPGTLVGSRISAAHPSGYSVTQIANREEFARLVMRTAGCRTADRIATQTRVINYIEARLVNGSSSAQGGGLLPLFPSTVGGMPSLPVNTVDHTQGADPIPGISVQSSSATTVSTAGRTIQASGYTSIEEWLHRQHNARVLS